MFYERILAAKKQLKTQLKEIQLNLLHLPEGKIYISQNGNRFKWYKTDGHNQSYIKKENRVLAEQLAIKKFLASRSKEISQEINAMDFYLRHHHQDYGESLQLLTKPGYQELLSPYFTPLSEELSNWMHEPYDKNPNHPEHLTHKTSSGNLVRSKSEAFIDMFLYLKKIPFRYENPLHLGGTLIYPDFTIRHPITGKYYYWEHFGKMDDYSYSKQAISKLQLYVSYNIIPSINLITTYETNKNPLSTEVIEKLVDHYFL